MGKRIGYILLTHGPKPKGNLSQHPAGRQQWRNLRAFAESGRVKLDRALSDYARSYERLDQLPTLKALLQAAQKSEGGVLIDDLGRLFRKVPRDRRRVFLEELLGAGGYIYGARQCCKLRDLPESYHAVFLLGGLAEPFVFGKPFRRRRSKEALQDQTFFATQASARARRRAALERARELEATRDEFAARGERPTLAAIAEAANGKGLRNSRGNPWTVSTVSQSLRRLEDDRQAQEKAKARKMRRRAATATVAQETLRDPETPGSAHTRADGDGPSSDARGKK